MKKFAALFLLLLFSFPIFSKGPKVDEIFCRFDNQHLFVSFILQEGFLSQDVLDAIYSTKPVTFTYEIEVAKKRAVWYGKTTHRAVLRKTVIYDNLTQQYEITVTRDEEQTEKKSLTSLEEVEKELSRVGDTDMGLIVDLTPGENIYYVRARVTFLKSFFLWLFPASVDTGWKEKDLKTP